MKKIIFFCLVFLFLVPLLSPVQASYIINDFESKITVERNKKIVITETIKANFETEMHGIYRVIPVSYSYKGITINSKLKIVSIKDAAGNNYKYTVSRKRQSVELKIGDPDLYITGEKVYIITYGVSNILQKYDGLYELYWNVTGHEWDQDIGRAAVTIVAPNAEIQNIACYNGPVGTFESSCIAGKRDAHTANYKTVIPVGYENDFTIVASFSPESDFVEPGKFETMLGILADNWGYAVSGLPFLAMFFIWFKRGRDLRYVGDNIYYDPKVKHIVSSFPFDRKYLPTVYSPIKGLSPAELGVIIDEKVDIKDVVSEIIELARNKFIEIEKIEKKKLFGNQEEYMLTKLKNDDSKLKDYQGYLLESLFSGDYGVKTIETLNKFYDKEPKKLKGLVEKATNGDLIIISSLKEKFYKKLSKLKEKLYEQVKSEGYFAANPEKIRQSYFAGAIIVSIISLFILIQYAKFTGNELPIFITIPFAGLALLIAAKMPRRTPLGYSVYRQLEGLYFYVKKGKWRYDIEEKRMFFEEMLPIAISLGVVGKLASEMESLGVAPPQYIHGFTNANMAHSFSSFSKSTSSAMLAAPGGRASGGSSWSGGSGYSGGSGGGFGGGGGGGW